VLRRVVERLAEYNVTLEQEVVITREVADRTIWIEHGQQRDPNNRSPDFGKPYANPPGYFVNRRITGKAGQLSKRGKYNWLKDIQSLTPMTQIPDWMMSKYFYREMSPLLRYAAVPFLLLFQVSLLFFLIVMLSVLGVWTLPDVVAQFVLGELGFLGAFIEFVLVMNLIVMVLLILVAIPLFFLWRDVRRTLRRFGLTGGEEPEDVNDRYLGVARGVFDAYPEVAVFIYGHTHRASITEVADRVVVNTGTWLRRLHRKPTMLGLLPSVFYSSFLLNYVRVFEENGAVIVEYEVIEKSNPKDMTLLERLLTRKPKIYQAIPERTVVSGGNQRTQPVPDQTADQAKTGENIDE
jgi:hypothetical protein